MNGYNFTERVRMALARAREEAARLHHNYVGTEHELLGLLRDDESLATEIIRSLNVDPAHLVVAVEGSVKQGGARVTGPDLPYTSRAKKVLEFSMAEARDLNHNHVGTEHLLLGLLREDKGIAALVLKDAGITVDSAREKLVAILEENFLGNPSSGALRPHIVARAFADVASPATAAMAAGIVELLAQDDAVGSVFAAQGIDVAKLAGALRALSAPQPPGTPDTAA